MTAKEQFLHALAPSTACTLYNGPNGPSECQDPEPRATRTRLPAGPGHQARPALTDSAALFDSLAPRTPPASARGTTSPCSFFLSSPVRTRLWQQLTHPARPKTALNPFGTARSPWHLSANAKAEPGRGGGTESPWPIRLDAKHVPALLTSSRLRQRG